MSSEARLPRPLKLALIGLAYGALAVALTNPVWRSPADHLVGSGGDPFAAVWGIAWTPFAISHGVNPLFSDYLNHPTGFGLLWNEPDSIPITLLWPITGLWGPVVTYNVVMTGSVALAAFLGFLAIRRYVRADVAAAIGGLVYGFSPYVTGHMLGHANLVLSAVTPPLVLLLVDELVIRQRMRRLTLSILIALLATVQFFIAQDILLSEAIAALVLIAVLALTNRDQVRARAQYALRAVAGAAAIGLAVLAYPTWYQFFGPDRVQGVVHGPDVFVTDPLNFIIPGPVQWLYPGIVHPLASRFTGNAAEWGAYLGLPLVGVLLWTLWVYRRETLVRVTAIVAVVVAVLSMGPHLNLLGHSIKFVPLPWWLPGHLPVLDNILPNRLMLFVYLAAGIGLALALQRIKVRRNAFATVAVGVAALLPLVPHAPALYSSLSVPSYFSAGRASDIPTGTVVLAEPWPYQGSVDAELWQVATGMRFRLLGGYYVGPDAPRSLQLRRLLEQDAAQPLPIAVSYADRISITDALHALGVGAVVVGPPANLQAMSSLFTQVLGSPPVDEGGVLVWRVG